MDGSSCFPSFSSDHSFSNYTIWSAKSSLHFRRLAGSISRGRCGRVQTRCLTFAIMSSSSLDSSEVRAISWIHVGNIEKVLPRYVIISGDSCHVELGSQMCIINAYQFLMDAISLQSPSPNTYESARPCHSTQPALHMLSPWF